MKILIADSFPATHRQRLTEQGHQVTFEPSLDETTLAGAITDNKLLVVRSTKVNAATLEAGKQLKLVIRAGAGTNTIDKPSATELGIRVCNVPGANAVAVAELAMGLIISIDRNIPANVLDSRSGIWNKKKYSSATGLYGQKLGILGAGAIGLALAERARAFGMDVVVVAKSNRSATAAARIRDAGIQEVETVDELLSSCDIVSLHLPSTDNTRGMVNSDFLSKLQTGAILINTSRGELIDEPALIEAMNNRDIRAGLDVYNNEPDTGSAEFNSTLASHHNVCGTHHIGASTQQAQIAVADGVTQIIDAYLNGNLQNCVN